MTKEGHACHDCNECEDEWLLDCLRKSCLYCGDEIEDGDQCNHNDSEMQAHMACCLEARG